MASKSVELEPYDTNIDDFKKRLGDDLLVDPKDGFDIVYTMTGNIRYILFPEGYMDSKT